jgi:hypothetical protein
MAVFNMRLMDFSIKPIPERTGSKGSIFTAHKNGFGAWGFAKRGKNTSTCLR